MGKVKIEKWTPEQIEEYLNQQYPNGLPVSESALDVRAREFREKYLLEKAEKEETERMAEQILKALEEGE